MSARRKRALVINFFPAFFPCKSGGEMRVHGLYREVSKYIDITLISSTDFDAREEFVTHTKSFSEIRIPKDAYWREAYATIAESGLDGDLSGLAFAMASRPDRSPFGQRLRSLIPEYDIIIHEFPYSAGFAKEFSWIPQIYNAHNFELGLIPAIISGPSAARAVQKVCVLESEMISCVDHVFAPSREDARKFELFYGCPHEKISICPNGFEKGSWDSVYRARRKLKLTTPQNLAVFVGSQHRPNVEACLFILDIASQMPKVNFSIAGRVCDSLRGHTIPPNVNLLGEISDDEKHCLLSTATVFLNPIFSGTGTSLKVIEALGAGIPTISTEIGARGLEAETVGAITVCEASDFKYELARLVVDRDLLDTIAERARDFALKRFSWKTIAQNFIAALPSADASEPAWTPTSINLVLNDYPIHIFPSGGALRMRDMWSAMSSATVFLSFGEKFSVDLLSDNLLCISVEKTGEHSAFENKINEGETLSVNDLSAALYVASNPIMTDQFGRILRRAGTLVFEHCYMLPLLPIAERLRPDIPVIYSAHNVERDLKAAILQTHRCRSELVDLVTDLESCILDRADLVVACTQNDIDRFRQEHPDLSYLHIPNGSREPPELTQDLPQGAEPRFGFVGSAHPPNIEAVNWIINDLAPTLPEVGFDIVGDVCNAVSASTAPNVTLCGRLGENEKYRRMRGWIAGLNPMLTGGGSSLKVAEYLACALPAISTECGARGFDLVGRDAGILVELDAFTATLRTFADEHDRRDSMSRNARHYAFHDLIWDAIVTPYENWLVQHRSIPSDTTFGRLLLVTYRYNEPALGGAEEYLVKLVDEIRPFFGTIELAATDVEQLTNHHHFATRQSSRDVGSARVLGSRFDDLHIFPVDPVHDDDIRDACRRLEAEWRHEEHTLFAGFLSDLTDEAPLRSLSGFYDPEQHGGVTRRWTYGTFTIVAPADARSLFLSGWTPKRKKISINIEPVPKGAPFVPLWRDRRQSVTTEISGHFNLGFNINVAAQGQESLIIRVHVDEHWVDGDHRVFGVLLETVAIDRAIGSPMGIHTGRVSVEPVERVAIDWRLDGERALRSRKPDAWIEALSAAARTRPREMEGWFAAVRGPHSAAMNDWLRANASRFDCILVQGIPFDTIPSAVETLQTIENPPRCVLLPHFHSDDRFYYWRRYLDAFEKADTTLLFSETTRRLLTNTTRADFTVVPGGGIDPREAPSIGMDGTNPAIALPSRFFLVLGRKTGSKGYRRVIEAFRHLRTESSDLHLVIIGIDEDGIPVNEDGVFYLGRQSRGTVLNAIQQCIAVVSMSESESFGIVLCEAWKFGKPVIANRNCLSFRELVSDGTDGLLVGTDRELVEAMRRLASDRLVAENLGESGQSKTFANYTWRAVGETTLSAILKK